MVRNYTVRRHIRRLKIILKRPHLCKECPAMLEHNFYEFRYIPWTNNPCRVCYTFIGLKAKYTYRGMNCPCNQVGQEEATRLTYKAIKKFSLKSKSLTFLRK